MSVVVKEKEREGEIEPYVFGDDFVSGAGEVEVNEI